MSYIIFKRFKINNFFKARHEMMKNSVISSAFVIGVLLAVS